MGSALTAGAHWNRTLTSTRPASSVFAFLSRLRERSRFASADVWALGASCDKQPSLRATGRLECDCKMIISVTQLWMWAGMRNSVTQGGRGVRLLQSYSQGWLSAEGTHQRHSSDAEGCGILIFVALWPELKNKTTERGQNYFEDQDRRSGTTRGMCQLGE